MVPNISIHRQALQQCIIHHTYCAIYPSMASAGHTWLGKVTIHRHSTIDACNIPRTPGYFHCCYSIPGSLFYKSIQNTSAVRSTNLGLILISASYVMIIPGCASVQVCKPHRSRRTRTRLVGTIFFFSTHIYFPASGQGMVTGVVLSLPRFLPSIFIAHRVQQSHCSSFFIGCC